MDFYFSEAQRIFAESVRGFARRELADSALDRAHEPGYSWDIASKLSKQSLLGITIPEGDGGVDGTLMDAVIAIQELALVCPKSADVFQAGNFGAIRTFAEYASPRQKERLLPDLLSGKALLALGMSEPDAGSAVTNLKTSARKDGDYFVVNGSKVFSTHSPDATDFLIYIRFGPGIEGIGSIVVKRNTKGFDIGEPTSFMSGEQWSQLYFNDCRIHKNDVLLGPGGFKKQIAGFNVERIGNAARALNLGRHAFEIARGYAETRIQFGRPISEFQGIQWKFSEMATKLDAAKMLLYRAAANADKGLPSVYETSVAKLACNTVGFESANEAMQIMGGYGFSTESLVEYCVKRTRGWMIAGGSIEMLKNKIAEEVFGRRFSQRPPTTPGDSA